MAYWCNAKPRLAITLCSSLVSEFVFNISPTAKVIWRLSYGLESHQTDWNQTQDPSVQGECLAITPSRDSEFITNVLITGQMLGVACTY